MSGLLLMFRIKSARKLVWASFKVVDSLVLAILMGLRSQGLTVRQVSLQHFKPCSWGRMVQD